MYLERIGSPADVRALDASDLPVLCQEIRRAIVEKSAAEGGHVGSNLGVVELTVALHRVFESPRDQIVFDVSHQTYAHKMLTGRAAAFTDPAHYADASGFANPRESEHDLFAMGHTSTSVSLACGLALARDRAGENHDVVAVIGDGSLSGGLAFEGFDNLAELGTGVLVIINDNGWSIAENHGGIYANLAELRATGGAAEHNFFRSLGLDYRFVADGNDLAGMIAELEGLRGLTHPVVLHVCTAKGSGYDLALADPERWHHPAAFDAKTGEPRRAPAPGAPLATYAEITGAWLSAQMETDSLLVGVNAATPYIMGFNPARRAAAGSQFVDVGIAEQHAVTFTAALARGGAHPVLGIYGVFLQRAYDQLWHDLCLNALPATILTFGCSVFGTRDATHLGLFDITLLSGLPGLAYLAPVCREEYEAMLAWAVGHTGGPVAIRVPGQGVVSRPELAPAAGEGFAIPRYQTVRRGSDVAILALGSFFELGERAADALEAAGVHATLVNPRFALGVDMEALDEIAASHRVVLTLEDGILEGGWGEQVARHLGPRDVRVRCFGVRTGYPDRFDVDELLASNGLTPEAIAGAALDMLADQGL
ncbi:MAG: 1-deoxy-D-xylulose-5-phosphate synthase [Coriobacteriaceae bacterium]|nr:1-deoxy-D-xylulose-5-phosphate synthase [Coriobacteriaceae bacterium]